MFPWLDRIFGTHYLPKEWPERYGIEEPMPHTLAGQFVQPFVPDRPLTRAQGDSALETPPPKEGRIGVGVEV
jgi:hypothetical protein